ncbi:phosphonate C-P lyase system protein PhnH [Brachybacterium sp. ACRRE]|uniref:phosphonate C-P lyase system protein PhnH n=1 Tax=Brachybacterium sp. ACRRE TaxID=2918184 RepID=UPI001EF27AFA|nr:phosphonate C-P lyase system protein PhnH [Brachybacterium sp. ACRRE]MCG7309827.1 phosphonate C-P lyase system protein PhnH [Brachybacterium sp. ACRRE]
MSPAEQVGTAPTSLSVPAPGLEDPTRDSQQVFRAALEALARPGAPQSVAGPAGAPDALGPALAGVLLTLLDAESPVHLAGGLGEDEDVRTHLSFHTGAPIVEDAARADMIVAAPADVPRLGGLSLGTDEAPHRSATVIIDARATGTGADTGTGAGTAPSAGTAPNSPALEATGPGIESTVVLRTPWARPGLIEERARLAELFPRGVDLLVVAENTILGLPRTTRLRTAAAQPTTPEEA